MNAEIAGLLRTAASRGHRTPTGHHCHTLASLLSIEPEHERHARRRLAILAVQTKGLAVAVPSHDGKAQP